MAETNDIVLRDLIESASLLHGLPEIFLIAVSVEQIQPMTVELSDPVRASLPRVLAQVHDILQTCTAVRR